ncbi:hypothetical protein ROJ8625_02461 [Roseivivax jejudonensis]|uniref:YdhG-like domain-containing protein n=1 Tax=Roseivivax jejudonensis TaxID=1529041 RepID=A0A1X6ZFG4_9RHOB|nr:DUF1801 domain-containing protein [Roseivivax jejudonensis]SLN49927.1 hypothetical protein ROJ8625_02461 [Roseivivax jejudonensis]
MRVDARLGTFEDVVAGAPAHAGTLRAVRALVADVHPDALEAASRREGSVWWGWGPGKMTHGYAYAMPHARHVNLGFFRGTSLADPAGLLQGTGKALRHVKLAAPDDAARPEIRALLVAARDERRPSEA